MMICVRGLVQHYGVRPVLKGIDLDVEEGELVAVMGPNGMGKSTLLGAVGGVLSPQRGYVEIGGYRRRRRADEELAIRRMTVYLPDHPWLPVTRTGREFLLATGTLYGVETDRLFDHIERLLRLFNLTEKADSPISSYSSGQQKKVAVAAALVTDAKVMVLDEPFSGGLDPSALVALRQVLLRLAERKDVTVMLAAPVPELIEGLAHRIALIRDGRILACDTVEGLRKLTGDEGALSETLDRLMNPETMKNVEYYLEGEPK